MDKRTNKQKQPLIFLISALTAKEQLNVWNVMQGRMSPGEPIDLEASSSITSNTRGTKYGIRQGDLQTPVHKNAIQDSL